MTLEEFTATLEGKTPPPVSPPLVALWHDGKGRLESRARGGAGRG